MEKEINIKDVYDELKKIEQTMVTKQELGRAIESMAVLSNPETMAQICASESDISRGNVRRVSSVNDI